MLNFKLPSKLRNFKTSKLRNFETSKLRNFETSKLRNFETSKLQMKIKTETKAQSEVKWLENSASMLLSGKLIFTSPWLLEKLHQRKVNTNQESDSALWHVYNYYRNAISKRSVHTLFQMITCRCVGDERVAAALVVAAQCVQIGLSGWVVVVDQSVSGAGFGCVAAAEFRLRLQVKAKVTTPLKFERLHLKANSKHSHQSFAPLLHKNQTKLLTPAKLLTPSTTQVQNVATPAQGCANVPSSGKQSAPAVTW
jgi:hypothetical protein